MISREQNDLMTRVGPGTPAGNLLRNYWQPVALVDQFLNSSRPVLPIKVLGEEFVLIKSSKNQYGLLDRHCPHRGADLAYGRYEDGNLRCVFHGWLFDVNGRCLETPAEPEGSRMCEHIRQRSYPVVERSGILFAWLGAGEASAFPHFDCFTAPDAYTFAFKGDWDCNWLQAWKSASTRRTPRSCTAISRTKTRLEATASSFAASRRTPNCRSRRCCANTTGRKSAFRAPTTACA